MMDSFLFDASSILIAVREFGEKAVDILLNGFTVSLAFYEVGNAIWKEFFLLRRVDEEKAVKVLRAIFSIIERMNIIDLREDESFGIKALVLAGRFNITFYDTVYLAAAQKIGGTLVTEDEKLKETAEKMGIKIRKTSEITP